MLFHDALPKNATVGAEQKIEDFVFHDLRCCAVTNLADPEVDMETNKVEKLDAAVPRI